MQERRAVARRRIFKTGRVRFQGNWPDVECAVRNRSIGGACLEMPSEFDITLGFSLTIGDERMPFACRPMWRQGKRVGVTFS